MTDGAVLSAHDLHKSYREGALAVDVLRGADLEIAPAEIVAIVGASGSGKSTLLHVLGGLDAADRGAVHIEGRELARLSDPERGRLAPVPWVAPRVDGPCPPGRAPRGAARRRVPTL